MVLLGVPGMTWVLADAMLSAFSITVLCVFLGFFFGKACV